MLAVADRYPDEVAGMVLADSTAPKSAADLAVRSDDGGSDGGVGRVSALVASTARLGLGRLIGLSDFGSLSAPLQELDQVAVRIPDERDLRHPVGRGARLEDRRGARGDVRAGEVR